MSTPLHPGAERIIELGVHRALLLIRRGHPLVDAERVLTVATAAAMLIDAERETLDP
jgi:hypothetical protein